MTRSTQTSPPMFVYCPISKDITRIFSWKLVSGPSGVDNASYMLKYCLGEEWPIESLSTPFFNQRGGEPSVWKIQNLSISTLKIVPRCCLRFELKNKHLMRREGWTHPGKYTQSQVVTSSCPISGKGQPSPHAVSCS